VKSKVKKILLAISLIASLTVGFSGPARASFVGLNGWVYLQSCTSDTDSDCIESAAFALPGHDYGVLQPSEVDGTVGVNTTNIYTLDGYKGPDGTNKVRVEARIDNGNIARILVGGFGVAEPTPKPAICNTNPSAQAVCKVLGDIDPTLVVTVAIRLKTINPGLSQGTVDNANIKITKESYGTKVTASATAMRYMGYIRWKAIAGADLTTHPTGDFISHVWNFYIYDSTIGPFGNCNAAGAAFVGANAEESKFPTFDRKLKSLDMQTASSHFEPDGTTAFKGQYFARISAALVKCVWGIDASTAATKAEIQIVSNGSDNSVASVISNYQDGWLKIDARNYEYSNPKIRFTIPTEVVTSSKPSPTASPMASSNPQPPVVTATSTRAPKPTAVPMKTTITCIKGKTMKTLAAIKPTCPAGYKKK
jgi:hypothetical protein